MYALRQTFTTMLLALTATTYKAFAGGGDSLEVTGAGTGQQLRTNGLNTKVTMKNLIFGALMCACQFAFAFDISCSFGAMCISTQGTKIPSKKVIEMSEYCGDFTRNDIGQRVLKMSIKEINVSAGTNINHPVFSAFYAFDKLRDTPLKFTRRPNVEDMDYYEIKRACLPLNQGFNNDSKWSK